MSSVAWALANKLAVLLLAGQTIAAVALYGLIHEFEFHHRHADHKLVNIPIGGVCVVRHFPVYVSFFPAVLEKRD